MLAKKTAERLPYSLGRWAARIPYRFRLGTEYTRALRIVGEYASASPKAKADYALRHLRAIVEYAQREVPFYRRLYGSAPIRLASLEEFRELPTISKQQVRDYFLEASGAYQLNTGGSTGGPLAFYVDRAAWAREWAHIHFIWRGYGYRPSDLMVTMMGRPVARGLSKYNLVHNEFLLDPYAPVERVAAEFIRLMAVRPVRFIQGYPSHVFGLFKAAEQLVRPVRRRLLARNVRALLFSSEYPSAYMARYLQEEWGLTAQLSWYGHSEMCVLAHDPNATRDYIPLQTYGFAEEADEMLLGTSFHNFDMPLIRYRTEDLIEARGDAEGLMSSFRITGGRTADFIEDRNGRKHALTLFLGRHHRIYNHADFIQLHQSVAGKATYYIVPSRQSTGGEADLRMMFDIPSKLEIDFDFRLIRRPVRTRQGKLKIRITDEDLRQLPVEDLLAQGDSAR